MAYNEELAKRVQLALKLFPKSILEDFQEKKMFGGLAFLYKGKMTIGIIKNDLMVRVLADKMKDILSKNYARPMDFTSRPLKEFIYVSEEGFKTEEQLQRWIELGLEHAECKLNMK